MGCSASRPVTVITSNTTQENYHHQITTATSSSSSESSSVKTRKAFTGSAPLIHHPPARKGDTDHLVSLTSTTYGYASLLSHHLPKNDTKQQHKRQPQHEHPDSVVNTWELMHDLDEDDELQQQEQEQKQHFNLRRMIKPAKTTKISKPLWKHLSEESLLSKMDPNVGATYRRALSSRHLGSTKQWKKAIADYTNTRPLGVVVYFTSLRGVRKTHEECCDVRAILRGLGVAVDERDVSMDAELRRELAAAMGGRVGLPQVFVRGRHAGGAEEVRRMHESGELAALVEGLPRAGPACEACAGVRFVPCRKCSGGRKVFVEEEMELRRCRDCNENGLTRCPVCC